MIIIIMIIMIIMIIIIIIIISVPPQLTYLFCAASMISLKFSKSFKILFMNP